MCCCGSEDDYYTATPYRPDYQQPHPSVSPDRQPGTRRLSRREIERRERLERIEKWERQAQATEAAHNYGWPASRGIHFGSPGHMAGNRDSMIEPHLAGGLAALPGSDFTAFYDPERPRQLPRPPPPVQQPRYSPPRVSPPPPQRPPYYQQRFVYEQPPRMPPMGAAPSPLSNRGAGPPVAQQYPSIARRPVVQPVAHPFVQPQTARLVRRDTNGISECSDDDDQYRLEELRGYTVSPI